MLARHRGPAWAEGEVRVSESLCANWKIQAVPERRDLGYLIVAALAAFLKTKKK